MTKKKIEADFFAKFTNLAGLQRQGTDILYTKSRVSGDGYETDLWCLDTKTETSRQLTKDIAFDGYQWDGTHVLLTGIFDTASQAQADQGIPLTCFYRLHPDSGEMAEVFRVHKTVTDFAKVGDGRYILL